jgi:cystathionine beta-lyase
MHDFSTVIARTNTNSIKWNKYQNKNIIPLWVADMDFKTAPQITQAINDKCTHGIFGYSDLTIKVKDDVANYLLQSFKWEVKPKSITWLAGVHMGLNLMSKIFTKPDESIITFSPIYPPFLRIEQVTSRKLITLPLKCDPKTQQWLFDFDLIEKTLNATGEFKPKLIMLCNPHNPVGRVWSKQELNKLLDLAIKYNLLICSDEIHCDLILEPSLKHTPFASLNEEAKMRTITLMSPSKTYNIASLGCAFAVIENQDLMKQYLANTNGLYAELNELGLLACKVAYNECSQWHQQLIENLRINKAMVDKALSGYDSISVYSPEATYLSWIDMRRFALANNVENPSQYLESHGLGLSDGADFGAPGFVRLNFACPQSLLTQALDLFTKALD